MPTRLADGWVMVRVERLTVLGLLGLVLAGCAVPSDEASETSSTNPTSTPVTLRMTPTAETTTTSTTSAPVTIASTTTLVDHAFVDRCVDHVLFLSYTGDLEAQNTWNEMRYDKERLEAHCAAIAQDPSARDHVETDIAQLNAFFAAQEPAPPTTVRPTPPTTVRPAPTTTYPQLPPRVQLSCPSTANGDWEWYQVDYGYAVERYAPIVEWGMNYGDGKSFTTGSEASAEQDLFWHRYTSPGSYRASAWVIDVDGRRAEDSCTFNWHRPTPPANIQPAVPSGGGCDPNYTGCVPIASDVDCAGGSGNGPAYTGKVQVIGVDIYGLDRDGDGWGCE